MLVNGSERLKEGFIMEKTRVYKVAKFSLGHKVEADIILFQSLKDLEQAYKDIDNGLDIYVQTDDKRVTKILHQTITAKIYDGTITLSANVKKEEEQQLEEVNK